MGRSNPIPNPFAISFDEGLRSLRVAQRMLPDSWATIGFTV